MEPSLIQELKRDNLCTYFVLPLLRLNKFSFTGSNFINSYLTKDHHNIVVQVYDLSLLRGPVFIHPGYKKYVIKDGYFYLVFEIPKMRKIDIQLFIKGKYSAISDASKEVIYSWSGLPYKQANGEGKVITDCRLLALSRHKALREAWESQYGFELDSSNELLDIPNDRSFIDL